MNKSNEVEIKSQARETISVIDITVFFIVAELFIQR